RMALVEVREVCRAVARREPDLGGPCGVATPLTPTLSPHKRRARGFLFNPLPQCGRGGTGRHGGRWVRALELAQYPSAMPSLRGSEPPIRTPRSWSIQIA